jgi:hypothetical protein
MPAPPSYKYGVGCEKKNEASCPSFAPENQLAALPLGNKKDSEMSYKRSSTRWNLSGSRFFHEVV